MTWVVSRVRTCLFQHGFGYVWQNQYVHNEPLFIQQLKQRLKDEYLQTWNISVNQSSILCDYRLCQSSPFDIEKYVSVLDLRKFRRAYVTFGMGASKLEVHTGRYNNTPANNRLCRLCHMEVEDAFHFLLKCSSFIDLREKLIPRKYTDTLRSINSL